MDDAIVALAVIVAILTVILILESLVLYAVHRRAPGVVAAVLKQISCRPVNCCRSKGVVVPEGGNHHLERKAVVVATLSPGAAGPDMGDVAISPSRHSRRSAAMTPGASKAALHHAEDNEKDWEIDPRKLKLKYMIGKGNFGEVWLATWFGSPVAVKTVLPELQGKEKLVKRFIDEIVLMSTLHHPNIVLFLGACRRRPHLCMVMEYCVHGSLHHFLKNESSHGVRITMSLVYRFALDVARGVYYLHRRRSIVQRDLKARNILVDQSLNAKVADFGLSRILDEDDEQNKLTACGTPAWTAPEIVKMERYTEKVDVYSFGIIMWEILTRSEPYGGKNGIQIAFAAAQQGLRPPIPSYCPPEYAELMQQCWAHDPSDRPTFQTILKRLFTMKKASDAEAAQALGQNIAPSDDDDNEESGDTAKYQDEHNTTYANRAKAVRLGVGIATAPPSRANSTASSSPSEQSGRFQADMRRETINSDAAHPLNAEATRSTNASVGAARMVGEFDSLGALEQPLLTTRRTQLQQQQQQHYAAAATNGPRHVTAPTLEEPTSSREPRSAEDDVTVTVNDAAGGAESLVDFRMHDNNVNNVVVVSPSHTQTHSAVPSQAAEVVTEDAARVQAQVAVNLGISTLPTGTSAIERWDGSVGSAEETPPRRKKGIGDTF